jgi:hypothetical protein
LPGTTQVQLLCGYTSSTGKLFKVAVNYALPVADYNPYADFDLGCTTKFNTANGDLAWNSKKRVYRVVSLKAWSYAAFVDPYNQITESDVAPFEGIAQTLLKESLPASHLCTLPGHGKAAAVPPKYWGVKVTVVVKAMGDTFEMPPAAVNPAGVAIAGTQWNGVFLTKPQLTGQASDIVGLEFPDVTMSVGSGGCTDVACMTAGTPPPVTHQMVTFHFGTSALAFKYTANSSTMLEVPVTVTSSTDPSCATGSTGTLTLTQLLPLQLGTPNDVVLNACGSANLFQPTAADLASPTHSTPLISVIYTIP